MKKDSRVIPTLLKNFCSMIGIPLKVRKKVVGVLFLYDKEPHYFTETECSLIETLANQAAIAIKKASLFRGLRRKNIELTVLNEIGRAVSASDVKSIAEVVYHQTSKLINAHNFFLCLYDKDVKKLHFVVWFQKGKLLKKESVEIGGLTEWVYKNKMSLLIQDWDEEESSFHAKAIIITERQRSWLGVPMLIGEEFIGILSVQNREPNVGPQKNQLQIVFLLKSF